MPVTRASCFGGRLRKAKALRSTALPGVSVLSALVSVVLGGCDWAQGLEDNARALGKPATIRLDLPGYQVAEGDFNRTSIISDYGDEIVIATEREVDGENHLFLYRFDRGTLLDARTTDPRSAVSSRDLGAVSSYERQRSYATDVGSRYHLFWDKDGDGVGTSWNVDLEGNPVGGRVEDAIFAKQVVPSYAAHDAYYDRLELDVRGGLWAVRGDEVSLIAEGVTDVRELSTLGTLWSVENETVVVRDRSTLVVMNTHGSQVSAFEPEAAEGVVVFRDGKNIRRSSGASGVASYYFAAEAQAAVAAGCSFVGFSNGPIWLSPCGEGRLLFSSFDENTLRLSEGPMVRGRIRDYRHYGYYDAVLVVDEDSNAGEVGSLFVIDPYDPKNPIHPIDDHAAFCDYGRAENLQFCLRCDGVSCDRYELTSAESLPDQLRGAATNPDFAGWYPIGARSLLAFHGDGRVVGERYSSEPFAGATKTRYDSYVSRTPLADNAVGVASTPLRDQVLGGVVGMSQASESGESLDSPLNWVAFVRGSYGDRAGSLSVVRQKGAGFTKPLDLQVRNVDASSLLGLAQPSTVLARSPNSADLRAIYLEAGAEETLEGPITDYFVGEWQPGLYYVVSKGPRKGLWFAPPK